MGNRKSIVSLFYLCTKRARNRPGPSTRVQIRVRIAIQFRARFVAQGGKVLSLYHAPIITQPSKSYYISGGRINPMICPLKLQRAVMVVHKTITARYKPRSGP
jgi:hypothetical protein